MFEKTTHFPSLCLDWRSWVIFMCALRSASPCFVLARARLNDNVHNQHSSFPSTYKQKRPPESPLASQNPIFTFLSSSWRSKAHFCLHCSQLTGGPYLISEFVHLWHLLPINAAIILQYSQAVGLPYALTFCSHFLHIVLVLPFDVCWNSERQ